MTDGSGAVVHVDGSCPRSGGPGGWGAIVSRPGREATVHYGRTGVTTNNRMELAAALEGLSATRDVVGRVTIVSDSQYVVLGVTEWMPQWLRWNWRSGSGSEVSNLDMWKQMLDALHNRDVAWLWVKGHASDRMNEMADMLAGAARMGMPDIGYVDLSTALERKEAKRRSRKVRSPKEASVAARALHDEEEVTGGA